MPSGYSKTPLAKKLGLKAGHQVYLYNEPEHYFELFTDLPEEINQKDTLHPDSCDFIHLFCTSREELLSLVPESKLALRKSATLWVSWPKGKSSIATDLKRDIIREMLLSAGLVDVKVAAIDEDWSGLKFVYRLKDR